MFVMAIRCDGYVSIKKGSKYIHPKMSWPGARSKSTLNNRKRSAYCYSLLSGNVLVKDLRQANTHTCKGNSSVSTQIQTEIQLITPVSNQSQSCLSMPQLKQDNHIEAKLKYKHNIKKIPKPS